jgi:hypothetical protein
MMPGILNGGMMSRSTAAMAMSQRNGPEYPKSGAANGAMMPAAKAKKQAITLPVWSRAEASERRWETSRARIWSSEKVTSQE